MKDNKERKDKAKAIKSFEFSYDETERCVKLKILDPEGMYPCIWYDPKVGTRRIIKTRNNRITMT
jgi:hypothetical protein